MSYDFNRDMNQWASTEGEYHPDRQWLLSSVDTWHENPHYEGDPQPHPEDMDGLEEDEVKDDFQQDKEASIKARLVGQAVQVEALVLPLKGQTSIQKVKRNIDKDLLNYFTETRWIGRTRQKAIQEIVKENFKKLEE
tara:strand:+ start:121 stop:531 length:411 start_codon:yes stop_codon:yes gene_type:complete